MVGLKIIIPLGIIQGNIVSQLNYWFIYLCGSFVETISLFTGRRKRRVGGRFMGQLVHGTPPKYWHSNSVVVVVLWRQKSSTPSKH